MIAREKEADILDAEGVGRKSGKARIGIDFAKDCLDGNEERKTE